MSEDAARTQQEPGYSIVEPTKQEANPFPGADGTQFDLLAALGLDEMRMRMWYYEPGGSSTLHRHGVQEEVYYFLDGPAQIQIGHGDDEELVDVSAGSAVRVSAETPRQIINTSDSQTRMLAVAAPNQMEGDIWDAENDEYVTIQDWFQRFQ
jgi:mannose-6-phosphate isomerase-like protein (cupin superfamily)